MPIYSLNDERFILLVRRPIESCQVWSQSLTQQIDLAFNVFFLFYFFLRVWPRNEDWKNPKSSFSSSLLHKINFDFGVWIFIHGLIFLPFHPHLPRLFSNEIGSVRRTFSHTKLLDPSFDFFVRYAILSNCTYFKYSWHTSISTHTS